MAITLGARSRASMTGLHPDLVRVIERAAQMARPDEDFTVLEGVRSKARQQALYAEGRTTAELRAKGISLPGQPAKPKVTWTLNSNHFVHADGFGHAFDAAPFPIDWNDTGRFDRMALLFFRAAAIEGVKLRWGADWDGDGKIRERGESDSPHFELAA